jgi:hypothetical protein
MHYNVIRIFPKISYLLAIGLYEFGPKKCEKILLCGQSNIFILKRKKKELSLVFLDQVYMLLQMVNGHQHDLLYFLQQKWMVKEDLFNKKNK